MLLTSEFWDRPSDGLDDTMIGLLLLFICFFFYIWVIRDCKLLFHWLFVVYQIDESTYIRGWISAFVRPCLVRVNDIIPYIPWKNKQKKNLQWLCGLGSKTDTDLVLSIRVKFQFWENYPIKGLVLLGFCSCGLWTLAWQAPNRPSTSLQGH